MSSSRSYLYPLFMIGILFFVFGFLTWINGVLIPYFQICMELSNFQATLVAFSSYFAYFVMALPSALVLRFTGYKKGMVLGLCIMAIGTLLFIPAAYSRIYFIFLTGLFVTASGLALIQTAANPYIAIIGPIEGTAQRIGIMGIANKTAGIISLVVLGKIFLSQADNVVANVSVLSGTEKSLALDAYALRIVQPYIIITIILFLVALLIYFSNLPEVDETAKSKDDIGKPVQPKKSIFHYPYLILGVISLFVASACETIPIDGIILYSRAFGIPVEIARHFSTYTLYVMLMGYLSVSVFVPKFISQSRAMQFAAIWGLLFTGASYFTSGMTSIYCLILLGFSASMLWGTIWGLSIQGLGKYTKTGAAMLLMSVIGGGIFPVIFGRLLDVNTINPQNAMLLLIPCYLVILGFSSWGFRLNSWTFRSKILGETVGNKI